MSQGRMLQFKFGAGISAAHRNGFSGTAREPVALNATCPIIAANNTRQGYALRSTLKPAGYFFLGPA